MIDIPGIIVVEGNQDKAFLSSFINGEIFVTNGFDVSLDKINLLKQLSIKHTIFLLLDPDDSGEKIRKTIKENIDNYIDINITFKNRNNYKKKGVAECEKEAILEALKPYEGKRVEPTTLISAYQWYDLGINQKTIRKKLAEKFNIPYGNFKSFVHYLNLLEINEDKIREVIDKNGD